ncbi:MAG: hypothetical protein ACREM6_03790, partial [Vulcanimicrobiaceae bacterium]
PASMGNPNQYFRRVPQDLYDALKQAQAAKGNKSGQVSVDEQILNAQGKPQTVKMVIEPPYSGNPLQGAGVNAQILRSKGNSLFGLPGFRVLANAAIGPIEGFRPQASFDLALNYRFDNPGHGGPDVGGVSSLRAAIPSTTQPWGLGIRQNTATTWSRIWGSANLFDTNAAQVHDLTNPSAPLSGAELAVMKPRIYIDIGNRNRERFDVNGKGMGSLATMKPDQLYARGRAFGYIEAGGGEDFLKYGYQGGNYASLNGYDELLFHAPDFRAQLNFMKNGKRTLDPYSNSGLQDFPPKLYLDPALQASWTKARVVPPIPYFNGPNLPPPPDVGRAIRGPVPESHPRGFVGPVAGEVARPSAPVGPNQR